MAVRDSISKLHWKMSKILVAHFSHEGHVLTLLCDSGVCFKVQRAISSLLVRPTRLTSFSLPRWRYQFIWETLPLTQGHEKYYGTKIVTGTCQVSWRFVLNFARPAELLNRSLWRDQQTHYKLHTEDESLALQTLQRRLISPPVYGLLRSRGIYTLHRDACDRQVGRFILKEKSTSHEKPIYYS